MQYAKAKGGSCWTGLVLVWINVYWLGNPLTQSRINYPMCSQCGFGDFHFLWFRVIVLDGVDLAWDAGGQKTIYEGNKKSSAMLLSLALPQQPWTHFRKKTPSDEKAPPKTVGQVIYTYDPARLFIPGDFSRNSPGFPGTGFWDLGILQVPGSFFYQNQY